MNTYVVCFLFDRYDVSRVLMCLKDRTVFAGKFNGIGGKVEADETPYQAVIREVYEETGCTMLDTPQYLHRDTTCDLTGKPDAGISCAVNYFAGIIDGAHVAQQAGESELLAWIPTKTIYTHPDFFADFPRADVLGKAIRYVAERYIQTVREEVEEVEGP